MCFNRLKAAFVLLAVLILINPSSDAAVVQSDAPTAEKELDALKTYLTYYQVGANQITAFGQWHDAAWNISPVDTAYFRTVCNTVAVGALYKAARPLDTTVDVSLDRLKAMLLAVMNEYDDNPTTPTGPEAKDGWGYSGPAETQHLNWDTGFISYPCTLAAALMWNQLDSADKALILSKLKDLADRIYAVRDTSWWDQRQKDCRDTKAEEVVSDAAFLAAMSQFYRSYTVGYVNWSQRARDLMGWVFAHLNVQPNCLAPSGNYDYTVTNHDMYPHPNYGLVVADNIARAVLPWSAQGITIQTNPVYNITDLAPTGFGNEKLYGGSAESFRLLYNANVAFVKDNVGGAIPPTSDFTFQGTVYKASVLPTIDSINFRDKSYLGVPGGGEWAMGARFQNSAFAFASWLYSTYYSPNQSYLADNYSNLLQYQAGAPGYGYLQTRHTANCDGGAQTSIAGWSWEYLPSTCPGTLWGVLVQFFWPSDLSLSRQVNTQFLLNSFSAFNHLVSYMYARSTPYWAADSYGNSTLPDFGEGQVIWGSGSQGDQPVPGKYDSDTRLDYAVWRPTNGTWYIRFAKHGTIQGIQWGANGDKPVPGDYDKDLNTTTDYAVWRPSSATWWVKYSDTGAWCYYPGDPNSSGDIPVPADYNHDGVTDFALWRPSDGTWRITYKQNNQSCESNQGGFCKCNTSGSSSPVQWGAKADKPVPGDYDGDGQSDYAVWRPSSATWWVKYSDTGAWCYYPGDPNSSGDIPVPADYNHDGVTDFALWRPSDGTWRIMYKQNNQSCESNQGGFCKCNTSGSSSPVQWGAKGDKLVPGDYNADGQSDYAVWRPSQGTWWVKP